MTLEVTFTARRLLTPRDEFAARGTAARLQLALSRRMAEVVLLLSTTFIASILLHMACQQHFNFITFQGGSQDKGIPAMGGSPP